MNIGYPSLCPQPNAVCTLDQPNIPFGVSNTLLHGLDNRQVDHSRASAHPLDFSEGNWLEHRQKMDMVMLRNVQGVHAPLRLQMEENFAQQVQRLPCLPSSNILLDTLRGRDGTVGFEDILCDPFNAEAVGQPHVLMEKRLGML